MPDDNQQSGSYSNAEDGHLSSDPLSVPTVGQASPLETPVAKPTPSQSVYSVPATSQNVPANKPNEAYFGLTGSQMKQEKQRLPIGIYVIVGILFIGFVIGFFDSSQTSGIYTIANFLDLLLAVGLLFRLSVARKLMIWLSGLILALSILGVFMLFGLQQRISQLKTNYEDAISRIDQSKLTPEQKQQLDAVQASIAVKEKQVGKTVVFTYVRFGVMGAETLGVIIYLSRPKVKEVFRELET